MAELLSREKEFIKLNEELDKLASATPTEHKQQTASTSHGVASSSNAGGAVSPGKHEQNQRFYTYTRNKGPSTLLKKRGAGDGTVDPAAEQNCGDKDRSASTTPMHSHHHHVKAISNSSSASPHTDTNATTSAVAATAAADNRKTSKTSPPNASSSQRRYVRSPDSGTRTYNRSNGSRAPNTMPFTVKYRNPKFVQSPSLEGLLRDETAALRLKVMPKSSMVSPSGMSGASGLSGGVRANIDLESNSSTVANTTGRQSTDVANSPSMRKQVNTDGLIKFLKSKITILEEDHERISKEMNQQKELLEKTLERNKKIEQQRDQAFSKHTVLSEQLTKIEAQLEDNNRRQKERVLDFTMAQKELENAKRELKLLVQTNGNLEKRLYRANEELENTKNALTLMKNSERELKDSIRAESECKEKQIKSLKKQRADLLNAYKKQLYLIDNLKRQNVCMEQSKMIVFGEKEFNKVLEWNTKI